MRLRRPRRPQRAMNMGELPGPGLDRERLDPFGMPCREEKDHEVTKCPSQGKSGQSGIRRDLRVTRCAESTWPMSPERLLEVPAGVVAEVGDNGRGDEAEDVHDHERVAAFRPAAERWD